MASAAMRRAAGAGRGEGCGMVVFAAAPPILAALGMLAGNQVARWAGVVVIALDTGGRDTLSA
jgi:hypothetical protein